MKASRRQALFPPALLWRQPLGALLLSAALLLGSQPLPALAAAETAHDRGVHLVRGRIPMPDGVELAATFYMPADLAAASAYRRCSNTCRIARTMTPRS